MKKQNEPITMAADAVQSLTDIADLADTAHVEVTLDTVASAFSKLKGQRRASAHDTSQISLAEVLSRFVEDGLTDPVALSYCDEITNLIEFKDYEGYSEDYVADRLEGLLNDLHDELHRTLENIRSQKDD